VKAPISSAVGDVQVDVRYNDLIMTTARSNPACLKMVARCVRTPLREKGANIRVAPRRRRESNQTALRNSLTALDLTTSNSPTIANGTPRRASNVSNDNPNSAPRFATRIGWLVEAGITSLDCTSRGSISSRKSPEGRRALSRRKRAGPCSSLCELFRSQRGRKNSAILGRTPPGSCTTSGQGFYASTLSWPLVARSHGQADGRFLSLPPPYLHHEFTNSLCAARCEEGTVHARADTISPLPASNRDAFDESQPSTPLLQRVEKPKDSSKAQTIFAPASNDSFSNSLIRSSLAPLLVFKE